MNILFVQMEILWCCKVTGRSKRVGEQVQRQNKTSACDCLQVNREQRLTIALFFNLKPSVYILKPWESQKKYKVQNVRFISENILTFCLSITYKSVKVGLEWLDLH